MFLNKGNEAISKTTHTDSLAVSTGTAGGLRMRHGSWQRFMQPAEWERGKWGNWEWTTRMGMGNGEWECRMEIRMSISCCTWLAQFFWTKEKLPRLWLLLLLFLLLFLCCCCGALNAENPCCINNVRIMVQEAVQLHKYACAAIKKLLSVPGPEREEEREEKKDRSPKHCSHLGNCCWRCCRCCCCCCYTYYPGQVTNLVSNCPLSSFSVRLSVSLSVC